MGLYDRDYAREPVRHEQRARRQRLGFGPGTITLAVAWVLVQLLVEAPFLVLVLGLLFVWWFGQEVERLWGSWNLLGLFGGGALVAAVVHLLVGGAPLAVGGGWPAAAVGGGVLAVVLLYTCVHPRHPVFGVIPLWALAGLYVLLGVIAGLRGDVAQLTQLAGAVYGFGAWKLDLRVSKVRLPSPRPRRAPDSEMRQQVDALLARISSEGIDSLTDEERAFLKRASHQYGDGDG